MTFIVTPTEAMALAFEEARRAASIGEVPVGAVVTDPLGRLLAQAGNRVEERFDPSAHAEILALRAACKKVAAPRLPEAVLYVTLEPCAMCAQAIANARIKRVVFGAYDPKGGAVEHGPRLYSQPTCHHHPEIVGGVRELEAAALLTDFFRVRR